MLIIFDLDDTLVKTSESIIPHKLKEGFQRTQEREQNLLSQLLRLDKMSRSSMAALEEFQEINGVNSEVYRSLHGEMTNDSLEGIDVDHTDHAHHVLEQLAQEHHLCLVSKGVQRVQTAKMNKAKISTTLFSDIRFCQSCKKQEYESLAQKYTDTPSDVVVCGDRVGLDLMPAKKLGFTTVQMVQGRGVTSMDYFSDVDYKIIQLVELFDIIEEIERKQFLRKL